MMRARSANCWGVEWVRTNCSSTSRWSGTSVRGLRPQIKLTHEDEVLVRMPIYQYLRDCGYRVLEAASVDEATLIFGARATISPTLNLCGRIFRSLAQ